MEKMAIWWSIGINLVLIVIFVTLRIRKIDLKSLAFKSLAGVGYLLTTLIAMNVTQEWQWGTCLLLGQVFGLLGDVYLDQKYIHKESGEAYTHFGFSAFGIGHLIFGIGYIITNQLGVFTIIGALVIGLAVAGVVVVTEKPFGLQYGKMKWDVGLYGWVIGSIIGLPLMRLIMKEAQGLDFFFFGMVTFLLSDLILSQIYFGKDKDRVPLVIGNYVFYYGAQIMLCLTLVFG